MSRNVRAGFFTEVVGCTAIQMCVAEQQITQAFGLDQTFKWQDDDECNYHLMKKHFSALLSRNCLAWFDFNFSLFKAWNISLDVTQLSSQNLTSSKPPAFAASPVSGLDLAAVDEPLDLELGVVDRLQAALEVGVLALSQVLQTGTARHRRVNPLLPPPTRPPPPSAVTPRLLTTTRDRAALKGTENSGSRAMTAVVGRS